MVMTGSRSELYGPLSNLEDCGKFYSDFTGFSLFGKEIEC